MGKKKLYAIFALVIAAVYYGLLVLVTVTTKNQTAHDIALVCSTLTMSLMVIHLCDRKDMRADVALICALVAYWVLLIPVAYLTPENRFFLRIDSMVYWQGLPTLIIALAWYAYQAVLATLDKDAS